MDTIVNYHYRKDLRSSLHHPSFTLSIWLPDRRSLALSTTRLVTRFHFLRLGIGGNNLPSLHLTDGVGQSHLTQHAALDSTTSASLALHRSSSCWKRLSCCAVAPIDFAAMTRS